MKKLLITLLTMMCSICIAAEQPQPKKNPCQSLLDGFLKFQKVMSTKFIKENPDTIIEISAKQLGCKAGKSVLAKLELYMNVPAMDTNKKPLRVCLYKRQIVIIEPDPEQEYMVTLLHDFPPIGPGRCDQVEEDKKEIDKKEKEQNENKK